MFKQNVEFWKIGNNMRKKKKQQLSEKGRGSGRFVYKGNEQETRKHCWYQTYETLNNFILFFPKFSHKTKNKIY